MNTIPNKGTMIYYGVKRFYHLKCLGQQNVTAKALFPCLLLLLLQTYCATNYTDIQQRQLCT